MKHKKLIVFCLLCFVIYLIYSCFHTNKINYLSLGDSLSLGINAYGDVSYGYSDYLALYLDRKQVLGGYSKDFSISGSRISDLQHQLDTNQHITVNDSDLSLKKCLRESDLVTLSIGANDLISAINMSTIDIETLQEEDIIKIIDDLDKNLKQLFKELRKYAKKEIIFIGYYYPYQEPSLMIDRMFSYLNDKLEDSCTKYDITYINTYYGFKNNPSFLPNPTNIHPGPDGYQAIANLIVKKLKL